MVVDDLVSYVISNHGTEHVSYTDCCLPQGKISISGISIVSSTVGSGTDQGKHKKSASLPFGQGIH